MTLDYGNYGIFLIMGNAGFMSSAVVYKSGVCIITVYGVGAGAFRNELQMVKFEVSQAVELQGSGVSGFGGLTPESPIPLNSGM